MKSKPFLALLLSVCVSVFAFAQTKTSDAKDDDVVRITTNLVQVDAVVTKDGKVVTDLTADDFEIYEDGKKQTITSFAFISNVSNTVAQPATKAKTKTTDVVPFSPLRRDEPRRIMAFVIDDLGLSAESMSHVRKQMRKFVEEELQPNDLIAIIRTGSELGALQQFTNDKRLLSRAVERLRWNMCSRVGVSVLPRYTSEKFEMDPGFTCGGFGSSMSALKSTLDAMAQLPGRKSLVLLSDSVPIEDQEVNWMGDQSNRPVRFRSYSHLLQKIAEKAIRSSVVIYSVDTQGLQYTGMTAADSIPVTRANMNTITNEIMSMRSDLLWRRREGSDLIARQTGGFLVRNSNDFGLKRIIRDQSGYYLIGYRPTGETFNRRFHHLKAKVKRSGMTVRTRFGFFGVSEEEVASTQRPDRNPTNMALMSPFREQDIELNLTSFFMHDTTAGSVVRSFVHVDPEGMRFQTNNGQRQGLIELHGVLFGDNGVVAEQLTRNTTLTLSESQYEEATRNGMVLTVDIPVRRPGFYQVRFAARNRNTSRIGSAGQFVDVPDLKKKRMAVSGIILGEVAESSTRKVEDMIDRPGTRRFDPNSNLHFVFMTYNGAGSGRLIMEPRLFRDGKMVYSAPEVPIEITNQADPNRVLVNGTLRLGPDLEVGNYYLQVVLTDRSVKKPVPVVQWIDFDIVK